MDTTNTSQGITAIPVTQTPIKKVAPGPQETIDSLTRKARIVLIVLLILFPPYAWYLMAKNSQYHGWIGNVIIVNGVIGALLGSAITWLYVPTLVSLQTTLGESQLGYSNFIVGIVVSIILIVFGLYLKIIVRKYGKLSFINLVLGIVAVMSGYLIPALIYSFSLMSIIHTSYILTSF